MFQIMQSADKSPVQGIFFDGQIYDTYTFGHQQAQCTVSSDNCPDIPQSSRQVVDYRLFIVLDTLDEPVESEAASAFRIDAIAVA